MKFMGYRRPDGSVGVRNNVLVLATVGCAAEVARKVADAVNGAVSFVNPNGCAENPVSIAQSQHTLAGLASNPNVYGVVAIGLGCELNTVHIFEKILKERRDMPYEKVVIQEEGGTINAVAKATRLAMKMAIEASTCVREECDISEFILGTKCGASDATSGLVSNPVMGLVTGKIIEAGGTSIVSETLEMVGAEHLLAKRAATPEVADKILNYIKAREDAQNASGGDFREGQPSPGNKAGGITTIEEKSLGCMHKGGDSLIMDMVPYATKPSCKGLVLMDAPCYDMLNVTALIAAGCQAVVFTTGRGNAVGNPIAPVIKVTANGETYRNQEDNHDIDMSSVIEKDVPLEEMADTTLNEILAILSGKMVKAEALDIGYTEVVYSRVCDFI